MEQAVIDFMQGKRLAVVGLSHDERKFCNTIYKELKARGYQVYAVSPNLKEYAGDPCYPNLAAVKDKVDGAVICIRPEKCTEVIQEASQVGLRNVWLQQGAESPEAIQAGKDLGLNLISQKCILMYAQPVRGFHGFHRGFVKLFGKL